MGYTQKLGLLAQSVFQDSSLNVGIGGAPSGSYKFEVTGTGRYTGLLTLNNTIVSSYGLQVNNSLGFPGFVAYQNSDSSYSLQMATTSTTTVSINSNASNSYINTAGNFGLGNASPTYKLDVTGTGRFTSSLTSDTLLVNAAAQANVTALIQGKVATAGTALKVISDGNGTDKVFEFTGADGVAAQTMTMLQSGNVGLGVTNPQTQLQMNGTITFSEPGFDTVRLSSIDHAHSSGSDANNFIRFNVSNGAGTTSERMRINGAGNVLINTTSDNGYKLQVAAEMYSTGYNVANTGGSFQTIDAGGYITLKGATGTGTQNAILFGTNGTEKARIISTGDLQIRNPTFGSYANTIKLGTYVDYSGGSYISAGSNPTLTGSTSLDLGTADGSGILIVNNGSRTIRMASLAGSGSRTVTADASGNLSASSDSSLKQEDKEYKIQGLAEILQLQPRAYKWLSDIEIRGEEAATEIGFFADEVNPIIPSAAPKGNDDLFGFYDRAVIAAMVKAIQELQEQINELKNK
jgi:hypothetical protein